MPATKIATCCYCGTGAALVLTGTTRHHLACASCGAPLSQMTVLPAAPARPVTKVKPSHQIYPDKHRPKPEKRKKSKKLGSILWDKFEDLIDDILD